MTPNLNELRVAAGAVNLLAAQCQEDVAVSVRLDDGRVLAPTTAQRDLARLGAATDRLRALLAADGGPSC